MAAPLLRMHARHHPHGALSISKARAEPVTSVGSQRVFVWTQAILASIRLFQGARSIYCGAHRLPAGKTVAKESSANVLPVRQRKTSKVDYYKCPRHWPRL